MSSNKYVALDVHSASIVAKVHNDAGKCVMELILETKAKTVRDFIFALLDRITTHRQLFACILGTSRFRV